MSRVPEDVTDGIWQVRDGTPHEHEPGPVYDERGVERLTYSNPHRLELERVWFEGRIVYAAEHGEVDVDPERVGVAQEYQIVYAVELGADGRPVREPERVAGQFNIYDSLPGMERYSPIWQFNFVIVPRDYRPNTLRSEAACLASGYPIRKSRVFEN